MSGEFGVKYLIMKYLVTLLIVSLMFFSCSQVEENKVEENLEISTTDTLEVKTDSIVAEEKVEEKNESQFCDFLVDWKYLKTINIYSKDGETIDSIANDSINENYVVGEILSSHDDFFEVRIQLALDEEIKKGYIKRKEPIGFYLNNYGDQEVKFYKEANNESQIVFVINEYNDSFFKIEDVDSDFVKISSNGKPLGWIKTDFICASPYTTCS